MPKRRVILNIIRKYLGPKKKKKKTVPWTNQKLPTVEVKKTFFKLI